MAIESESDSSETATSNVTILKFLKKKGIHHREIIGLSIKLKFIYKIVKLLKYSKIKVILLKSYFLQTEKLAKKFSNIGYFWIFV